MDSIFSKDIFPTAIKIPDKLFYRGNLSSLVNKKITIVGTRRPTEYGKFCIKKIIGGLKGYPVTLISGLAIGIDSLVHEEALKNNIHTIAIPGSSLEDENIYPRGNIRLARKILENNGALISMWQNQKATSWTFPSRNGIMAAIADIVIIIEAKVDSGTLITAREAIKRNVLIGAIPGNIDNLNSYGPNLLIQNGACVITKSEDILKLLNIENISINMNNSKSPLLKLISENNFTQDELAQNTNIPISEINIELTMLEISGEILIDNNGIVRATN